MTRGSPSARPEWVPGGDAGDPFATYLVPGLSARGGAVTRRRPQGARRYDVDEIFAGIIGGDRSALARGITLVESRATAHRDLAADLLERCLGVARSTVRIGITGVPGAGKSTFIEALGLRLIERGHRIAVLAVDPSSSRSGGSLLGDKTRMEELSRSEAAFIRPSPAGGTLGGVAARTRETITLVETAGYDTVLVETVGVGQSEVEVRSMVAFFLLLQIAGAGDELQGLKKGVVELADAVVVNKADGDNRPRALRTAREFRQILHYLSPFTPGWEPEARVCSAIEGSGLNEVWAMVERFLSRLQESGEFHRIRRAQNVDWLDKLLREAVWGRFLASAAARDELPPARAAVAAGTLPVAGALRRILSFADESIT